MAVKYYIPLAIKTAGATQRKKNGEFLNRGDVAQKHKPLAKDAVIGMRGAPVKEAAFITLKKILSIFQDREAAGQVWAPEEGVSAIFVCNSNIADKRRTHARTVQRHRKVLFEAGFIHKEVFHGSHHPFEIHIKDIYLGVSEALDAYEAKLAIKALIGESEELETAIQSGRISCTDEPQDLSLVNGDDNMSLLNFCKEQTNEDNQPLKAGHADEMRASGRAVGGRLKGTQEAGNHGATMPETGPGGRDGDDPLAGLEPGNAKDVRTLAMVLWVFARKVLWPTHNFTAEREAQTLQMIYRMYARIRPEDMDLWHERFVQMARMAAEFVERNGQVDSRGKRSGPVASGGGGTATERFVQYPWKWFDISNPNGIVGIWKWWQKRERAQEASRAEWILYRAVQKWEQNEALPLKKQRDRALLYSSLRNEIAAFNRPLLLEEFKNCIERSIENGKSKTKKENAG